MRKVLFITYYFPPSGGPAVQRILRFVRHLPGFGWKPIVLTVKDGDFPVLDRSLLVKVPPETLVYRTFIPEPYKFYRKFISGNDVEALDITTLAVDDTEEVSLKERIAFWVRSWIFIPDPRIGWLPFAVYKGWRIVRQHKVDLIFSSGPPNTVHLIAWVLKIMTRKKWVSDFRDPWFKHLVPARKGWLPRKIEEKMCRLTLTASNHVVAVGNGVGQELASSVGRSLATKYSTIFNGFDSDNFKDLAAQDASHFRICYVGSFFGRYDPASFVTAMEQLSEENPDFKASLEMVFCGRVDDDVKRRFLSAKFAQRVKFVDYQSHRETLQLMKSSTLLLLYIIDSEQGRHILTTKLYEYLGSRKPILALAPDDSEAANIIRKTNAGYIVSPNRIFKIRRKLLLIFEEWRENKLRNFCPNETEVLNFEGQNLTRQLATVFDQLVI